MPELAEVEITRQKLLPLVRGRRVLNFWTDWVRGLRGSGSGRRIARDMRGRRILDVKRQGKVLFIVLSGQPPRIMAIHLRMSGRLEVVPVMPPSKLVSKYQRSLVCANSHGRWVHFRWQLSGGRRGRASPSTGRELRFVDPRKFGVVWYGSPADLACDPYLGRLGADMQTLPRAEFAAALARGRGMIKPFLLRQDRFSGIGNIIADESLWRARIHPETRIPDLDAHGSRTLHAAIRMTIRTMLASGGTSIRNWGQPDGGRGTYQDRRRIYGRAGHRCPRCRATLRRLIVGGRGTTVCPSCQQRRIVR